MPFLKKGFSNLATLDNLDILLRRLIRDNSVWMSIGLWVNLVEGYKMGPY